MISARQLANSYLARIADDVISLLIDGQSQVNQGLVGNMSYFRNMAGAIAYDAPIVARTMWHDMYGEDAKAR